MITAVFDTNVLVSAILGADRAASTPGELLRRWRRGAFSLILSQLLLEELDRTLLRPYLVNRISARQRERALATLRTYATTSEITITVQGVAPDPDDDHVLAVAVCSQAGYIVTGDRTLRSVGSYHGVELVSPREFLEIIEAFTEASHEEPDPEA